MLIFDQLKRSDPHLRLVAVAIGIGMGVLAAGLWWVQIVSFRDYQAHLETQSFRTVRVPAPRGKIFDRNRILLADNRPVYNISLYLEDLSDAFQKETKRLRPTRIVTNSPPFWKRWFGARTVITQYVRLKPEEKTAIEQTARFNCLSNVVREVAAVMRRPLLIDARDFQKQYKTRRFMPYPIVKAANTNDIARFEEQLSGQIAADLEIESIRVYPHGTAAAHVLGQLHRNYDRSFEGEDAEFDYRLPDYSGVEGTGIEYGLDVELRGRAGTKSVQINSSGYRRTETIWTPVEAGSNVVLSIDLFIQQQTEKALQAAPVDYSGPIRGAAVVMDVQTGDILAMASSPTFNPNSFAQGISQAELDRLQLIGAEKNRATQENYRPGSIFKTVIALACLDNGLDPNLPYEVQLYSGTDPKYFGKGTIKVYGQTIGDTAAPGPYDFVKALIHSSNSYFIANGMRYAGMDRIAQLGWRLHLGERAGLGTRQETAGRFPRENQIRSGWSPLDTAYVCFGQGKIDITPLQMTVLASALANGGKVLFPRLVDRIESQDPVASQSPVVFPSGRVRDNLGVSARSMKILRDAMLADVEVKGGTAYLAFHNASGAPILGSFQVCSKTGTAQNEKNGVVDRTIGTTWFLAFAPYDHPRYALVVMVEGGRSGGETCAPVGRDIFKAILEREQRDVLKTGSLASKD